VNRLKRSGDKVSQRPGHGAPVREGVVGGGALGCIALDGLDRPSHQRHERGPAPICATRRWTAKGEGVGRNGYRAPAPGGPTGAATGGAARRGHGRPIGELPGREGRREGRRAEGDRAWRGPRGLPLPLVPGETRGRGGAADHPRGGSLEGGPDLGPGTNPPPLPNGGAMMAKGRKVGHSRRAETKVRIVGSFLLQQLFST